MTRSLTEKRIFNAKRFGLARSFWRMVLKFTNSDYAYMKVQQIHMKHIDYLRSLPQNELIKYVSELYKFETGENLNINAPENFNQKIQWLKIFDNQEIKCTLSDKYKVREWVREKIGEKYLVPLLGVWDDPEQINFDALPEKFCLKANHASGSNIIVKDKSSLDIPEAKKKMRRWLASPYGVRGYEPQYFDIPRKIIAEKFIEQSDGDLVDYKIHCFNGEPKIIQVIGSRDHEHHTAKEAFFSPDWVRNDFMYHTYEQYEITPPKPEFLGELLNIARTLGKDFKYVRVDLYHVDDGIKFGEMTFTPACGFTLWGGLRFIN